MDLRDWAIKSWHILQEWQFSRTTKKYGRSYYTGLTQFEMEIVVEAVVHALIEELAKDGTVTISQLGRFSTVNRPARMIRSNLDGNTHRSEERRQVVFKPSAALLRKLNHNS